MLSCKEVAREHASDYLDGNLSFRVRWGLSTHLMVCRNCRRFMKQLSVVRSLLQRSVSVQAEEMNESDVQLIAAELIDLQQQQKKTPSGL